MTFLICFIIIIAFNGIYGSPIVNSSQKDKPYDDCVCEKFSCACCTTVDIPQIGLNDTACLSFAYLPNEYGISLVLQIDDTVLINETISAKNPPPICLPIPYIEDFVDACVHFTDLKITNTDFHGCASLEARMWWVYVVAEISLGCWDTASNKPISVGLASGNSTKPIRPEMENATKPALGYLNYKAIQLLKSMNVTSGMNLYTNEV